MKRSKVTLSLVALGILIPTAAIADNIHVQTNNVRASTYSNGDIYVDTGKTSVSVPTRHRTWYPWRYWRTPWQSNSNCDRSSYQQTTHTRTSDGKVVHQSSVSSYCR